MVVKMVIDWYDVLLRRQEAGQPFKFKGYYDTRSKQILAARYHAGPTPRSRPVATPAPIRWKVKAVTTIDSAESRTVVNSSPLEQSTDTRSPRGASVASDTLPVIPPRRSRLSRRVIDSDSERTDTPSHRHTRSVQGDDDRRAASPRPTTSITSEDTQIPPRVIKKNRKKPLKSSKRKRGQQSVPMPAVSSPQGSKPTRPRPRPLKRPQQVADIVRQEGEPAIDEAPPTGVSDDPPDPMPNTHTASAGGAQTEALMTPSQVDPSFSPAPTESSPRRSTDTCATPSDVPETPPNPQLTTAKKRLTEEDRLAQEAERFGAADGSKRKSRKTRRALNL